jgi:hypothetical protein
MNFPNKEQLIKKVQKHLNLKDDGIDGQKTWESIISNLNIPEEKTSPKVSSRLSQKALDLIIKHEVGGGESYYNKYLQNPTWPKGQSGVTIGIGYDIGYNSLEEFTKDWKGKISDSDFDRLSKALGKKMTTASVLVKTLKDISIPWVKALEVFEDKTIPRFVKETLKAFPNADSLHPDAFGALISIVFNRGASISGSSRIEMLRIRELISSKDYKAIAKEVRNMKRLWENKGLDGLLKRREEEAKLIESCD